MNLIDFAKRLPEEFTEQEFVDLMNQVIDMKQVVTLSEQERLNLFSGVQYLADYVLLAQESKGEVKTRGGHPALDYNGPFIPNILQRPDMAELDFAALDNFGVGEGQKHLGGNAA